MKVTKKQFTIDECPEAYLNLLEYESGIVSLDFIFVPEDQRRKGYGTKLLKKCFEYLKAKGINKITAYFITDDAIRLTFRIADEYGIEVLPRFCVVKNEEFQPIRYKTKEEIQDCLQSFMAEFGYTSVEDIPEITLLKNFGRVR